MWKFLNLANVVNTTGEVWKRGESPQGKWRLYTLPLYSLICSYLQPPSTFTTMDNICETFYQMFIKLGNPNIKAGAVEVHFTLMINNRDRKPSCQND